MPLNLRLEVGVGVVELGLAAEENGTGHFGLAAPFGEVETGVGMRAVAAVQLMVGAQAGLYHLACLLALTGAAAFPIDEKTLATDFTTDIVGDC